MKRDERSPSNLKMVRCKVWCLYNTYPVPQGRTIHTWWHSPTTRVGKKSCVLSPEEKSGRSFSSLSFIFCFENLKRKGEELGRTKKKTRGKPLK
jgi:hypothetical protein